MEQKDNRWLQHVILLTAPLLTVIDVFIVNIAVPSIKQSLQATDSEAELIIAAYLLGYASFQVTGSRAGDIYGRKRIFLWGMLLFVVTSCLCGVAPDPTTLIVARLLQGVSGAFMMPQSLAYVQVLFPLPHERTKAIGYVGITLGIASVLGQFLGGLFSGIDTVIAGWRFIFFINLPIGLVAFFTAKKYLVDTKQNTHERFDYQGVALFITALSCLIYPLTEGREKGYPLWSFAMIIISIALFVVFVFHQERKLAKQQHPLIDMRLFKIREFNIGLLLLTAYFIMHTSYLLVSTIYFQEGLHCTPFQTGLYFSIWGACFMLSSFLSIRLVNAFGKRPIQLAMIGMMIAYVIQLAYFNEQANPVAIIVVMLMMGLCGGMVLPTLINLALRKVPSHFAGIASGTYSTVQQTASSFGICLIGGLFFNVARSTNSVVMGFHVSVYAEIACLALGFILLMFMEDLKKKN
ncbi:EmrB/QacA subfamily drug resistance transporter [Chitinophaga skermanii]|uniref:EmrB/QacA subfamily drug resistance transporter n=1 Tax=Chitinophaga skermanii TaxID=331697 RepID=A0A327QQM4_9BACT|nr:MFS transporter [Chitinophaga skermanii]RAJ06849.1 EmrB/QacA subfamily drug resistance transporter [Chitinophaga skermanii]